MNTCSPQIGPMTNNQAHWKTVIVIQRKNPQSIQRRSPLQKFSTMPSVTNSSDNQSQNIAPVAISQTRSRAFLSLSSKRRSASTHTARPQIIANICILGTPLPLSMIASLLGSTISNWAQKVKRQAQKLLKHLLS